MFTSSLNRELEDAMFNCIHKISLRLAFVLAINPALIPVGHAQGLQSLPAARHSFVEAFSNTQPLPKWSGDFLISWRIKTESSDSDNNLIIHGRDGKVLRRFRLWLPDAMMVQIFDVAGSRRNSVSVVGIALSQSGSVAPFLATISMDSSSVKVNRLSPFEGRYVTWGSDDTIWVLGYQLAEGRKLLSAPSHAILQHYDRNGTLLGKHLEWPAIECGRHPLLSSGVQIVSSPDRIGVLLPACSTWIELSPLGDLIGRWEAHLPASYNDKSAHFFTPVMTSSNRVYCQFSIPYHQDADGTQRHTGLFTLNRTKKTWEPVDTKAAVIALGNMSWLAGIDEDSLVYKVGAYDLVWMRPSAP
jgi:hypothetical protein